MEEDKDITHGQGSPGIHLPGPARRAGADLTAGISGDLPTIIRTPTINDNGFHILLSQGGQGGGQLVCLVKDRDDNGDHYSRHPLENSEFWWQAGQVGRAVNIR